MTRVSREVGACDTQEEESRGAFAPNKVPKNDKCLSSSCVDAKSCPPGR